jgi:hypothetical protein
VGRHIFRRMGVLTSALRLSDTDVLQTVADGTPFAVVCLCLRRCLLMTTLSGCMIKSHSAWAHWRCSRGASVASTHRQPCRGVFTAMCRQHRNMAGQWHHVVGQQAVLGQPGPPKWQRSQEPS